MRLGNVMGPVMAGFLLLLLAAACRNKEGEGSAGSGKGEGVQSWKEGKAEDVPPAADKGSKEGKPDKPKKKQQKIILEEGVTQVQVPGGEYLFGSFTGERFRNPSKEIDAFKVEVKPFVIDRYPFPNQKGAEPLTSVTLEEAREHCEKAGKRLCTELEWEVACKGLDNEQYPEKGVSGFGMEGIFDVFEWTDSPWMEPELPKPRGMVVKGNAPITMAGKPRCSYRSVRQPEKATSNTGFRCCQGEVNSVEVMLEPLKKPFEEVKDFPLDKLQLLVRSTPQMDKVTEDPHLFGEKDLSYVLMRREIDVDKSYAGYLFTTQPVWWRPVRGEELLVMTGYSKKHSFVLALYHLGQGKFKHASSLVLLESDAATVEQPIPVILVAGVDRTVINWAPCWNCSEGGSLYIDDKFDTEHTGDFLVHLSYRWGP